MAYVRSMLCLMVAVAASNVSPAAGEDYAVLVAGSNGYENYRHQADVCHAFQILMDGGFKREHIILMSYDDVAYDNANPFYGTLFNAPTGERPGVDVRHGCDPDYKGGNVTAANFLAVLKGDKNAVGGMKVLETNHRDNIFVNFVDHGGVGIVAFPNGDLLHASDLQEALVEMHAQKKFKQLTFYMEACESGSMFETLPTNISIYATTASNAQESSWGTYCPPNDVISGQEMGTCLGDLYSVNWMQNADANNLRLESLEEQYVIVRNLTDKSHVEQYGEKGISSEMSARFEGRGDTHAGVVPVPHGEVPSRDIPLHLAYYSYLRNGTPDGLSGLLFAVESRAQADTLFTTILSAFPPHPKNYVLTPTTLKCTKTVHEAVRAYCGGYTDYSLKHSFVAADLCTFTDSDTQKVVAAVKSVCEK